MTGLGDTRSYIDSLFDDTGMFGDVMLEDDSGSVSVSEGYLGNAVIVTESMHSDIDSGEMQMAETGTTASRPDIVEESCAGPDEHWVHTEGMVVSKLIDGFIRYSNYARRSGFEIRFRSSERRRKRKEEDEIVPRKCMKRGLARNWFYADYDECTRVRLQCVKGEKPRPNRRDPNRAVRSQASQCKAGVTLLNIGDSAWVFKKVTLEHNHSCHASNTRFMLNYRIVCGADELQIVEGDRAGVVASRIYSTFAVGKGGFENVPFSISDCHTIIKNARSKRLEAGDFTAMQKLFNDMVGSSEDFFYLYDTDLDGRVKNVFWADGRSRAAYRDFGDVVSFDTTHLKNRYKMPLAPFIGINHHGQSILLGLALICNEDSTSFTWVFEAWMKCMQNVPPKCIMTDQCQAIGNAIAKVFPHATHRWCLWHVMRNGEQRLKRIPQSDKIRKALKEAVHDSCTVEEFEGMWTAFTVEYQVQDNAWLRKMYDSREKWVPAYFLHEFWAGMHTTQRSEGMNNFFRSYVNLNTGLRQFAEQYCLFVGKRVDDEERENWKCMNKPASCVTRFPSEVILQKVYTVRKFLEVQNEAKGVVYTKVDLLTEVEGIRTYSVIDRGVEKVYGSVVRRTYMVHFYAVSHETICSCKKFSFKGIICRHMIAVWQEEDLRTVPQTYIVRRWRKDIFRDCTIVKIPNYALAFDKTTTYKKYEQIRTIMREISTLALGCDDLFDPLLSGLEKVQSKCVEFVESSVDVSIDSVGRIYKRHEEVDLENEFQNCLPDAVLDPVDRRGRGRVPTRRKGGGGKGKQQRKKRGTPTTHVFFV